MAKPNRSGMTLLEILIVMMIIMILVGGATFYYQEFLQKARQDRARTELRQLAKVLIKYESSRGGPITTYGDISDPAEDHNMNKLLEHRLVTALPSDPWGTPYVIDIERGLLYSRGIIISRPDGMGGIEDHYQDDVNVYFRPEFKATSAMKSTNWVKDQVVVEFSRPVRVSSVTTNTVSVASVPVTSIETIFVDQFTPMRVILQMDCCLPVGNYAAHVTSGVYSIDGARPRSGALVVIDQ